MGYAMRLRHCLVVCVGSYQGTGYSVPGICIPVHWGGAGLGTLLSGAPDLARKEGALSLYTTLS